MSASDQPSNGKQNNDAFRGFGLGTAILTAQQLERMYTWLNLAFSRINDPTIIELQTALKNRLQMAGVNVDNLVPVRAFANRSIIEHDGSRHTSKSLVSEQELKLVERAILECRPVSVKIPDPDPKRQAGTKVVRVWPLQILFHNIGWYLAFESDEVGSTGLLTVARLDRIELISDRIGRMKRSREDMRKSQQRLEQLCRRSGGIFLGDDLTRQSALSGTSLSATEIQQLLQKGILVCVRFRCSARVYGFIRSGNKRYPAEQMRLSGPLPADDWTVPAAKLEADPRGASHPYPVELLVPAWTVESNDFKGWLFGFGDGLRIESPETLRQKHQEFGTGIAHLYASLQQASEPLSGVVTAEEVIPDSALAAPDKPTGASSTAPSSQPL
jgi:hypothetical protein